MKDEIFTPAHPGVNQGTPLPCVQVPRFQNAFARRTCCVKKALSAIMVEGLPLETESHHDYDRLPVGAEDSLVSVIPREPSINENPRRPVGGGHLSPLGARFL